LALVGSCCRGCAKLPNTTESLRERPDLLNAVCELIESLLVDLTPEMTDDEEAKTESL
jgi:hypothetical protein